MPQIIKAWLGIFLTFFFTLIMAGCISVNIDINNAKNYKSDVVASLENSNYSPDVINSCIRTAADQDYMLSIVTYDNAGNTSTYDADSPASGTTDVYMVKVTMKYRYTIAFLNINSEKTLRGMAR